VHQEKINRLVEEMQDIQRLVQKLNLDLARRGRPELAEELEHTLLSLNKTVGGMHVTLVSLCGRVDGVEQKQQTHAVADAESRVYLKQGKWAIALVLGALLAAFIAAAVKHMMTDKPKQVAPPVPTTQPAK